MSDSNGRKRNLPSWMSSGSSSSSTKQEENDGEDSEKPKQQKNRGVSKKECSDFSQLMEGVVFVLSGFVNPDRGVLRSQMLEMGAEYQPDWNPNCTLLVCAFANTPKFKQVKSDGGTIISKDWISECYTQRKLVDIETYLLNAGKPWRKQGASHETSQEAKQSSSKRSVKQQEKNLPSKKTAVSSKVKSNFAPSKVKKWAIEDLKRTISWLENQDEKPEPGETVKIASEGILTCIQDAVDALKQGQSIEKITDQWACIPRFVEELAQLDGGKGSTSSHSKEDLCNEAMVCKQIYELECLTVDHDEFLNKKKAATRVSKKVGRREENYAGDDTYYDSDATIEMTEEDINQAYNTLASSL